jgi:ankyrin repeat protein
VQTVWLSAAVLMRVRSFAPVQYGQTALIFASFSGYQDIVEILLRYKALPDVQTKFGQTALMVRALFHFTRISPVYLHILL